MDQLIVTFEPWNGATRKYAHMLKRRMLFLANRIAENESRDLSYDNNERKALEWIVMALQNGTVVETLADPKDPYCPKTNPARKESQRVAETLGHPVKKGTKS